MLRASLLLLTAFVIQNICNYGFHFSMGRLLTVEEYGDLGTLNSLLMIFAVPCVTVLFVVSKFVSTFKAGSQPGRMKYLYFFLLKKITVFGLPALAILCFFSTFLQSYLNISSVLPIIVLAVGVVVTVYLQTIMGVVQGLQRFRAFALQVAAFGVIKFLAGAALVLMGLKLTGAVGGIALAPVFLTVIYAYYLFRVFRSEPVLSTPLSSEIVRYTGPVFIANLLMVALFSSDLVIIPAFFSDSDVGLYSSAITLGRAIIYVPGIIVYALFPKVAETHAKDESTRLLAFKGMGLALVLVVIGSTIFYFTPKLWIGSLYGSKYLKAAEILKYAGFALIPLSLLQVYMNYELAKSNFFFIWFMAAAFLLQTGFIFAFHESFNSVLIVLFCVPSAALIILSAIRLKSIAGARQLLREEGA